jgi:hypothetical protein
MVRGTTVTLGDTYPNARSPGWHHDLGCNVLFPQGHARWAAAQEYMPNFFYPFPLPTVFSMKYTLP